MTCKQFEKLSKKYLVEFLEQGLFTVQGDMLIHLPFNPVLRGVVFSSSSSLKTSFTAYAFAHNLMVPKTAVHVTYGARFGALRGKGDK
jgi:hypothetical protein